MPKRPRPGDTLCVGIWPISGNACRCAARPGFETCEAHNPAGDLRRPPPPDKTRCTATNKESGERCRLTHKPGGKVCRKHGGKAAQVLAKAEERAVVANLESLAANLVGTPVDNPLVELGKIAGRARAWMELLEGRVQALLAEDKDTPENAERDERGKTAERGIRYRGGAGEQTRAEVQLYERAMTQLGTLLTAIARLDIDRRLVQIEQEKVELVAKAVDAAIREAGLDAEQATAAKHAVVRHLRAVAT